MTVTDEAVYATSRPEDNFRRNRIVVWAGFCLGVYSGLLMGLWSFDGPIAVPGWLGAYADTSRRLARLGHIALFGLGFLNLHVVAALTDARLAVRTKRLVAQGMNFGNVILPLTLFAAAAMPVCKYLLPVPALALAVAVTLAAVGVVRGRKGEADASL